MITPSYRFAVLALAALTLAACADKPTHPVRPATSAGTATNSASASRATAATRSASAGSSDTTTVSLPDKTGIAACDNYLSTYVACHRAAGIYPANQLQSRYEEMRHSLIEDSQNPDMRSQLASRCSSLDRGLHQALHGRSCDDAAAPSSSNGH